MATKKKVERYSLPLGVALTTPAVRMLVVSAWACRDGDDPWNVEDRVFTVLAIQATLAMELQRYFRPGEYDRPPTYNAACEKGWFGERPAVTHELIVFGGFDDLNDPGLYLASEAFDNSNEAYRSVLADWPPEEDAARLSEVVAYVRTKAIEKAQAQEAEDRSKSLVAPAVRP